VKQNAATAQSEDLRSALGLNYCLAASLARTGCVAQIVRDDVESLAVPSASGGVV
jgi:hypothetical protein